PDLNCVLARAATLVRLPQPGSTGPVHVNFHFREPLMPNVQLKYLWGEYEKPYNKYWAGEREISKSSLEALAKTLNGNPPALIVCRSQSDSKLASGSVHLSEALHVPVLADPLYHLT